MVVNYKEYLESEHWKNIRIKALNYHGNKCLRCGESDISRLNVHHKTYYTLGKEDIKKDLTILCYNCHDAYHKLSTKTRVSTTTAFINGCIKIKKLEEHNKKVWLGSKKYKYKTKKQKIKEILSS